MASLLAFAFDIFTSCFCKGDNNNNNNQNQNQQQGQHQQQQQGGGYPGGNQQHQQYQQNAYPPQQQPHYNNQNQNQQNHNQNQSHHPPHGNKPNAGGYGQVLGPYHPAQDANMMNQSNAKYMDMRERARKEGDLMHTCFQKSKAAYASGDGAAAQQFSQEGKRHQQQKDQIDDEARDWIYYQNNTDSPPGTIDLHGLYVQEAIEKSEAEIRNAQQRGDAEIRFITGKGNHSAGHVSRLKPAIEDLMEKYNLNAHLDPHNSGVLIVQLQGGSGGVNGRQRGREIGEELEKKDDTDCVIM